MRERRILEEALRRARAAGSRRAEAFFAAGVTRTIEYTDRGLEAYRGSSPRGIGLRVFTRGRTGFSYGQNFSASGLERLAARAVEAARLAEMPAFPTPRGRAVAGDLRLLDRAGLGVSVGEDRERLEAVAAAAKAADTAVERVKRVSLRSVRREVRLLSTTGTDLASASSVFTLVAGVIAAREAQSEMGWEADIQTSRDALAWSSVGTTAARKAVSRLGATAAPGGRQTVILDREVVAEFLSLLGAALSADAVLKGKSLYAGQLGRRQASAAVTIIDDPTLPGAAGSAPFDDEGQPTSRKALIEAGVLVNFLHSLETAHRMTVPPAGNGFRRDFSSPPLPRPGNLSLAPGDAELKAWARAGGRVLLVDEILGAHTMNPVSGDFSVGAAGFVHERGGRRPFRGATIAGNIRSLFLSVSGVANDFRFFGPVGAPSVLVEAVDVSA